MRKGNKWLQKLWIVAGFAAMAMSANAFTFDPTITVDRALNSPTLTIRYSGASAALVELRVNGTSLGSRSVSAGKSSGETNFTLDMSTLQEGNNDIEVLLLDKTGRIIGTEKTTISADAAGSGPVNLVSPKMGATVSGPVEIKVGFGRDMRNSYVSFFVNNQFKAMTNNPPFTYTWDTTHETNGWHDVEAWLVDENSNTFKTHKVRVFVDNNGGQTGRVADPLATPQGAPVTPKIVTPKIANVVVKTPGGQTVALVRANAITLTLAPQAGLKPTVLPRASATGTKAATPAGISTVNPTTPTVKPRAPQVIEVHQATVPSTKGVGASASLLRIGHGFRTADRNLAISFNSKQIDFDVQPKVVNNVPLTPFRHLIEKAGGSVKWQHQAKTVDALADGRTIFLKIGDSRAMINHQPIDLEVAPFIEKSRTIVPLSFIQDSLNVNVDYDPATGHVLITSKKN